ncbi:DUF1330 domain-containing protein [Methylobacterium currus]|uniref:DUF1330 domain-containing protein n=1 Tax=Methylobacterium currus TaxID=2051553 RepID=A0A2R4WDC1_9HYPH|nr:DUF1330 domain-containing protein [Methylobacterium currus]AWB19552.1 DUF1330 domain-containing protein [Methylobacterium currus]UHC15749.1 DUF1330 domain-containing protein [Methylobacterium currus]
MAKGYWVGRVDVSNPEAYKNYVAANGVAFARFGGRFLVRGGSFEAVLGSSRARNVVIEFPSYDQALACWNSPEYQAARAKQEGGAEIDLIVIEGYDGPQPGEG